MRFNHAKSFVVIGATALLLGAFFFISTTTQKKSITIGGEDRELPVMQSQPMFFESDNFQKAIAAAKDIDAQKDIEAIMVPHHLLASRLIAEQVKRASGRDIETVVMIGPNHFNTGVERIATAQAAWRTPFGDVAADTALTDKFMADLSVSNNPEVFVNEHSIGAEMPFVKHYVPNATVMVVAYSSYATIEDVTRVSDWLAANLPPKSLVMYSIDFSHYLTRDIADTKDRETRQLIENRDVQKIMTLGNDHMDSPATLATALSFAQKTNLAISILENSNSDDFSVTRTAETTSYFILTFSPAKKSAHKPVSLLFAGDVMLSRAVGEAMKRRGDWILPFRQIAEFTAGADLFFGNLENPISDRGTESGGTYRFRADPRVVQGLKYAGFDILSIANNHIGDWGLPAFEDTLNLLRENGVAYVGGGLNKDEAHAGQVIEVEGTRFGFLAYTPLGQQGVAATENEPGITEFNLASMRKDIATMKKIADVVIVSLHMGDEYSDVESGEQLRTAQASIDAGAALVIGHHPHVVQAVEKYKDGYIAYSLGNFIFDQSFSPETTNGLLLRVTFDADSLIALEEIPTEINNTFQAVLVGA